MKTCSSCGAQLPDEAQFCLNCGKPVSHKHKRKENKKSLYALAVVLGILFLIIAWAMYYADYAERREAREARVKFVADSLEQVRQDSIRVAEQLRQDSIRQAKEREERKRAFETKLLSFHKKIYHQENDDLIDIEVDIKVDYPVRCVALNENIIDLISTALSDDVFVGEGYYYYGGDKSNGQVVVDSYGKAKIKSLQEMGIDDSYIYIRCTTYTDIRKTAETEKFLSYKVDNGGHSTCLGLEETYGVTFNKKDGSVVQVIKDPGNERLNKLIDSRVKKQLRERISDDLSDFEYGMPERKPFLAKNGVCFIYSKGEIGSMGLGVVEITIPYSVMKPYMTETALSLCQDD